LQETGTGFLPRLVLQSGAIIELTHCTAWHIGRKTPRHTTIEIDLAPYGGKESGVSRKHAIICQHNGTFTIEDTDSRNETWINGERLSANQRYPLHDGDILELGTFQLVFVIVTQQNTLPSSPTTARHRKEHTRDV
jgi:pSer/pThr/pTyr-binding forkhead associated (FHA) protein